MTLPAIDVVDLFPVERAALLDLLRELSPAQWDAQTVCTGWSVKDIVAHLLADELGRLSRGRDRHVSPEFARDLDIASWDGLLAAINRQNEQWVVATRRISPVLLIELLTWSGDSFFAYIRSLDLIALGPPVDWAGPDPAPVWLDIAREYTEYWVHQQHVRDAVGMSGFKDRRVFGPVLDAFCRALAHALRNQPATDGSLVRLIVTGDAGGSWTARRESDRWIMVVDRGESAVATVEMDQEIAWRRFTRGIDREHTRAQSHIVGDQELGVAVLDMVSILA